jgi:hypothetical protein
MQRLITVMAVLLGTACGESDVTRSGTEITTGASSWKPSDNERQVCRFEISRPPEAMRLFRITTAGGGRTCFSNGRVIVIIPKVPSGCLQLVQGEYDILTVVSQFDAESEYTRCSALSLDADVTHNPAIVFTRSNGSDEVNDAFMDFSMDLGALISNDGLQVTYFSPGGTETCLEGPDIDRVRQHIKSSQIVDPAHIREFVSPQGCDRSERK